MTITQVKIFFLYFRSQDKILALRIRAVDLLLNMDPQLPMYKIMRMNAYPVLEQFKMDFSLDQFNKYVHSSDPLAIAMLYLFIDQ